MIVTISVCHLYKLSELCFYSTRSSIPRNTPQYGEILTKQESGADLYTQEFAMRYIGANITDDLLLLRPFTCSSI